ncbi:MAG: hypothetical protein JWM71_804, partial [Solirubrobacteraceae bacterium]|nr:hypothetical protein [Solirubrobacteraceae bacterium]
MTALAAALHEGPLEDLLAEWAEVFASDGRATPFTSPTWAEVWWRHWSEGYEPWVVTVREPDGRLAGLAPLVLGRRGPVRILRGLGTSVGNYWDVLAAEASREAVTAAFAGFLREQRAAWDLFDMDRFPPGSGTPEALSAAGLKLRERPSILAPWVTLPATWDEYLATLSSNRRAKLRRHLRPLDSGDVTVSYLREPGEIAAAVERWQAFRTAWWEARGQAINPEHASERFRAFTAEVVAALVAQDMAVVREFRMDGEVIDIAMDFVDHSTLYSWLNGFEPRHGKLRMGHVEVTHCIRASIERGLSGYDFMVGTEPYKYEYRAVDRRLRWVVVGNASLRSRALAAAAALRDRIRPPGDELSRGEL